MILESIMRPSVSVHYKIVKNYDQKVMKRYSIKIRNKIP